MPAKKGSRARGRHAPDALTVRAVKTSGGPPSTTIHAEVKPEKLKRALGEFKKIEEVVAEVPKQQAQEVQWQETPLYRFDEVKDPPDNDRTVRYTSTSYGPSDADKFGVRLRVKTDKGLARSSSEARHGVREADKPRHGPARRQLEGTAPPESENRIPGLQRQAPELPLGSVWFFYTNRNVPWVDVDRARVDAPEWMPPKEGREFLCGDIRAVGAEDVTVLVIGQGQHRIPGVLEEMSDAEGVPYKRIRRADFLAHWRFAHRGKWQVRDEHPVP